MGCKNSNANNNVIVPSRSSAGSTLGVRTEISQKLEQSPNSGERKNSQQTFADYLPTQERQRGPGSLEGEENLRIPGSEKCLTKSQTTVSSEKRRISILDGIRQQIREDDVNTRQIRLNSIKTIQEQQKSRNVYKIKINGKLVAEAMSPRKNKSEVGFRVHRERSMTESTNSSALKKNSLRSTPKYRKRKYSDGNIKKASIFISIRRHRATSLPNIDFISKVASPSFLRIPTPERVRIKMNFEIAPKFMPKIKVRKMTGDDGVTTEKSDSSLSSFGHL